jgi:ribonuclease HI
MSTISYDAIGEEIKRLFNPIATEAYAPLIMMNKDLVVYNAEKGVSQVQFKTLNPNVPTKVLDTSVVAYIDGACRNNGMPGARAAYGVYFGPESPYNANGLLPDGVEQTSTRA